MANLSTTVTKAATNGYSLNLGKAFWDDESHTTFKYPYAKIENVADKLTLLTVTVENGSCTKPNGLGEPNLTDVNGRSATWIFSSGKSADEVQTFIRNITFTPQTGSNMNVNIIIDSNETTGFDNLPSGSKLTYDGIVDHYYLYVPYDTSWTNAMNKAQTYTLVGRKGYPATITNQHELAWVDAITGTAVWLGGSRPANSNVSGNNTSSVWNLRKLYTWNYGPESGTSLGSLPDTLWGKNGSSHGREPNGAGEDKIMLIPLSMNGGLNDVPNGNIYTSGNLHCTGVIVEFGGYEAAGKTDPGGRDTSKTATDVKTSETPMDVEAKIGNERYAPISEALDAAQDGDTITIVKDQVTAVDNATLKQGVTLEKDGQTIKSVDTDSKVGIDVNGKLTLKNGKVVTSANASLSVVQDGQSYDVTVPDSKTTVVTGESGSDSYVRPEHDGTVKIGDVSYTYTHEDGNTQTQIYIPDGMYKTEQVSKAAVAAGKTGTVKIDDNQTVEVTDAANATKPVTVERKDGTVEVTVPANAKVDAFDHTGITSTSGTLKVKPDKDGGRTTVTVSGTDTFTADGHIYTGLKEGETIPLGTYTVTLTKGNNVTGDDPQSAYYYKDSYEVTLTPDANYDLAAKDVKVTMAGKDVLALEETIPMKKI